MLGGDTVDVGWEWRKRRRFCADSQNGALEPCACGDDYEASGWVELYARDVMMLMMMEVVTASRLPCVGGLRVGEMGWEVVAEYIPRRRSRGSAQYFRNKWP